MIKFNSCTLLILSALIVLCSCGGPSGLVEHEQIDPGTGAREIRLRGMWADIDRDQLGRHGHLAMFVDIAISGDQSDTAYSLQPTIVADRDFTVRIGDTLKLELDVKSISVTCTAPLPDFMSQTGEFASGEYRYRGGVYRVSRTILREMAGSQEAGIFVYTKEGIVKGQIDGNTLTKLAKFKDIYF